MVKPILLVEDDASQRFMVETLIKRKLGFDCIQAENGLVALNRLQEDGGRDIRLVILDLKMPEMGGMEALGIIRQKYPDLPVIMLSGSRDEEEVTAALKLGAVDFLNKPFEGERLKVTVENALKLNALHQEILLLKNEKHGFLKFTNLIGHDQGLAPAIAQARKAAASDIQVLLTGETGTGKEVFAQALHGESSRAGGPFVAINCGAIPAQLVESTLFGHEKGAFTGAVCKSLGKFREADGGTIFLDEVADLPLDAQVKLLRVLQQKEVEPVGAGQPVPVNVRVISATHQNLEEAVRTGRFREDLYFRLNVLPIALPPLRDRKGDIPLLARHLVHRFCAQERKPLKTLSPETDRLLINQNWPGNVRQLENALQRAVIINESGQLIPEDFSLSPQDERKTERKPRSEISVLSSDGSFKSYASLENELIELALEHFDRNMTRTATALGLAKSTLYKKVKDIKGQT